MRESVEHVMKVTARPPIVMVEGEGSWLRDSEGRQYLDFVQGWAVNCLGHSHPVMRRALEEQAARLINCSPSFYNGPMARLATLIAESSGLRDVFFCNSGAEANEGAIKLARKWGQRRRGGAYEIVTMRGAFHGRTLATMSASGKPAFEPLFEPKVPGFVKVDLNDLAALAGAITERTAAVMLEPIQGEAGVVEATDEFLRAFLATRLGALSASLGHGPVRGRGLLLALALTRGDAGAVVEAAMERGLLINAPRPDTLRFMPALTVSREEVDEMLKLLEPCLP